MVPRVHSHYCSPLVCLDQWKRTCSVGNAATGSVHWDVFVRSMWRTSVEVGEAEGRNHLACSAGIAAAASASHSIVARLQSDSVVVGKKNQSLLKGMMMMMHGMMMEQSRSCC